MLCTVCCLLAKLVFVLSYSLQYQYSSNYRLQVENRSIPEIAHELARLQHLAAAGKLSTEDVTHGSMTISNIGRWLSTKPKGRMSCDFTVPCLSAAWVMSRRQLVSAAWCTCISLEQL